ncbi:N-acetylglucosamine kinase [Actinoplanes sp. CA-051413]|uniref:N-acetylglucosamine kinase n=1 Tax=Actinoplanes sp. CA-051413 TaxID=3239899 RepID=UPI003D98928C
MKLVLGVDAGGTASRAVVATTQGAVLGRGSAGPGNPAAAGPQAARAIGTAVRTALRGHDPATVIAGVVGVAGCSALADRRVSEAFDEQWRATGLTCPVTVVGDAVTAFAAGTPAPSGAVLIAGTGAVAARMESRRVTGTADGLGWLLGDEGSGLWLGLHAVRAVARTWPASAPHGLAAAVATHAAVVSCDQLVHWAGRQPPSAFAALAPVVCAAARAGDPLAVRLTAEAGTRLVATLGELGPLDGPVVLAGGLLTGDTPVREAVLAALPGPVATSHDPAVGAAWLALREVSDLDDQAAGRLHGRMLPALSRTGASRVHRDTPAS